MKLLALWTKQMQSTFTSAFSSQQMISMKACPRGIVKVTPACQVHQQVLSRLSTQMIRK
ncbi:hypothetical protein INR49_000790 [Caranx melampygus]|nr:hypothetical protein INR49_000790 [Caranx melampygus]